MLKASASEEESSGFDPSGASGPEPIFDGQGSAQGEDESQSTSQGGSKTQTDNTSLSQDPGTLEVGVLDLGGAAKEEKTSKTFSSELDNLDQAGNISPRTNWNGDMRGDFPNWAYNRSWVKQGNEIMLDLRDEIKKRNSK